MSILATGAGASEGLKDYLMQMLREQQLAEQVRSNKADETYRQGTLKETARQHDLQAETNRLTQEGLKANRDALERNRLRDDEADNLDKLMPGVMITPERRDKIVGMGAAAPERFEGQYFGEEFVGPIEEGQPGRDEVQSYKLLQGRQNQGSQAAPRLETVILDGKPVDAIFDPNTRRFSYRGEDITDRAEHYEKPAGQGGRDYIQPVFTGTGIVPFNTRTGQWMEDGTKPLRPSSSAEQDITKAQSTLYQIGRIEQQFSPDRVGPLKGRYNSMHLALAGEMGDEGLAEFQASIATLQNTVINLRTGAQMSEPEAQRILAEIPSMNLPPDVFMARLSKAREYFQDWLTRRARMAYGKNTEQDINNMTNPPAGGAGTPPPAPGGGAPAGGGGGFRVRSVKPKTDQR